MDLIQSLENVFYYTLLNRMNVGYQISQVNDYVLLIFMLNLMFFTCCGFVAITDCFYQSLGVSCM